MDQYRRDDCRHSYQDFVGRSVHPPQTNASWIPLEHLVSRPGCVGELCAGEPRGYTHSRLKCRGKNAQSIDMMSRPAIAAIVLV